MYIFFSLLKGYKKKHIKEFAESLLDEICDELDLNYPWNMEDGMAGIAWGFEHLIRHNFISDNSNGVLEVINNQIIKNDVRKIIDTSIDRGLKGLAHYVISRHLSKNGIFSTIDIQYASELIEALCRNCNEDTEAKHLSNQIRCVINRGAISFDPDALLSELVPKKTHNIDRLFANEFSLGIKNGYAGIGLQLLKKCKNT